MNDTVLEFKVLAGLDPTSSGNVVAGRDRELANGLLSHVGTWFDDPNS